jgi:hypothetical protein
VFSMAAQSSFLKRKKMAPLTAQEQFAPQTEGNARVGSNAAFISSAAASRWAIKLSDEAQPSALKAASLQAEAKALSNCFPIGSDINL